MAARPWLRFLSQPLSQTFGLPAPRKGEPFGMVQILTKSCPRKRGKWHEVPKGVRLKTAECRELFPLSFAYAQQLPRKRWRLIVRFRSLHIKPALKGDSSRARPVGDAARGESGGIGSIASGSAARRPYSNQRCGFRVAKAGGVIKRLIALCLSQPLSLTSFDSSPAGAPFGAVQTQTLSLP